jgi:hypothetical protein
MAAKDFCAQILIISDQPTTTLELIFKNEEKVNVFFLATKAKVSRYSSHDLTFRIEDHGKIIVDAYFENKANLDEEIPLRLSIVLKHYKVHL